MVNIGALRHRIIIEQQQQTSDGMGGFTTTYSTVATVWASINPISANERIASAKIEMETTHKIKIRYHSGLDDSSMRINYGTRYFDIVSIIDYNERNIYIDLLCKEEV